ncbi:unnamed protein product [Allacma fusca]|uniref:Mediator of RNA polymerase II transcription subunit 15 n=1 Tax=Allacma fusca TaxID=39272 RepID=A0A8J2Q2K4_9HEXA|nr:unnamed protein product [Allacma fusca]
MMSSLDNNNWRSLSFRQVIVEKIEEVVMAIGEPPTASTTKTVVEIENAIYPKAKNWDDYMHFVAQLIIYIKQMGSNINGPGMTVGESSRTSNSSVTMANCSGQQHQEQQSQQQQPGTENDADPVGSQLGQVSQGQVLLHQILQSLRSPTTSEQQHQQQLQAQEAAQQQDYDQNNSVSETESVSLQFEDSEDEVP